MSEGQVALVRELGIALFHRGLADQFADPVVSRHATQTVSSHTFEVASERSGKPLPDVFNAASDQTAAMLVPTGHQFGRPGICWRPWPVLIIGPDKASIPNESPR